MSQIILLTALVATVPTVNSDLKRRATTVLLKDTETALKNLFLTVVVKGVSPRSSQGG